MDDEIKIEGCHDIDRASWFGRVIWNLSCPKDWDSLRPTGDAKVRHCRSCGQNVHLVTSESQLQELAAKRVCMAITHPEEGTVVGSHRYRGG